MKLRRDRDRDAHGIDLTSGKPKLRASFIAAKHASTDLRRLRVHCLANLAHLLQLPSVVQNEAQRSRTSANFVVASWMTQPTLDYSETTE